MFRRFKEDRKLVEAQDILQHERDKDKIVKVKFTSMLCSTKFLKIQILIPIVLDIF